MAQHNHRGHPCTLAVPHWHYPAWLNIHDLAAIVMVTVWWPTRRSR